MQLELKYKKLLDTQILNILIGVLLAILYAPLLIHWVDGWLNKNISIEHEYFSHALIGLPFAAYIISLKRQKWQRLPNKTHPLGGFCLGLGAVFYLTGVGELVNASFPLILVGICFWLKGIPGFKLLWFPLLLIFLATPNPIPYLVAPFTLPLQQFIAGVAGFILIQLGLNVTVESIYLAVNGRLVEVAPYCAGLKMLFTSLYVTLMLLYWTDNLEKRNKSLFMLFGAILISVTGNIIRNTLLTFFHGTGRDNLFHWLHEGSGGDIYSALMLGSIVLLLKIIDRFETSFEAVEEGAKVEEIASEEQNTL